MHKDNDASCNALMDEELYRRFEAFDFRANEAFQAGLSRILAAEKAATPEVVRMAKVFFYSQHVELVDYDGYEAWRQAGYAGPDPVSSAEVLNSSAQVSPRNSAKYPATFADIVAMIETGKPIPGIRQIPDRLAGIIPEPSSETQVTKPWQSSNDASPEVPNWMTPCLSSDIAKIV